MKGFQKSVSYLLADIRTMRFICRQKNVTNLDGIYLLFTVCPGPLHLDVEVPLPVLPTFLDLSKINSFTHLLGKLQKSYFS